MWGLRGTPDRNIELIEDEECAETESDDGALYILTGLCDGAIDAQSLRDQSLTLHVKRKREVTMNTPTHFKAGPNSLALSPSVRFHQFHLFHQKSRAPSLHLIVAAPKQPHDQPAICFAKIFPRDFHNKDPVYQTPSALISGGCREPLGMTSRSALDSSGWRSFEDGERRCMRHTNLLKGPC